MGKREAGEARVDEFPRFRAPEKTKPDAACRMVCRSPHSFRYPEAEFNVRQFAAKMDALLELLESTADALAARWDMQVDRLAVEDDPHGGDFGPTIH
jgi:hypothetical protein